VEGKRAEQANCASLDTPQVTANAQLAITSRIRVDNVEVTVPVDIAQQKTVGTVTIISGAGRKHSRRSTLVSALVDIRQDRIGGSARNHQIRITIHVDIATRNCERLYSRSESCAAGEFTNCSCLRVTL